ncbi:MAG: MFS transporter, partial [Bdellovibrionia bacterium]
ERITEYFRRPVIGPLLLISFLSIFAFAQMEAVLFLLVHDRFGWSMSTAAFAFAYVGVVSAFTQGYLVRKLLPKVGERPLMTWGLFLSALGLALIGYAPEVYSMAVVVTVMSVGVGLRNPSLMGSISVKAGEHEQGSVLGVNQSLASLGRILGPPLGGIIYARWVAGPFVVAGVMTFLCLFLVWRIYDQLPDHGKDTAGAGDRASPGGVSTRNLSQAGSSPFKPNVLSNWPEARAGEAANSVTRIGEYQLQNLMRQRIQFLFVDLRAPGDKPEFPKSLHSSIGSIVQDVTANVPDRNFPVVVVCENGSDSASAAEKLVQNSFLNVVVLEGGTRSLS